MVKLTLQEQQWGGDLGNEYTADIVKNPLSTEGTDKLYVKYYGISRTKLNKEFLGKLDRSIKILEVGCNVGVQFLYLQKMGFKNLYGVEINPKVIERGKSIAKNVSVVQGSALDIPFKDNYFDLVFTSGVLIHISPKDIKKALKEIHRCSKKYIFGFEYFDEKFTEILNWSRRKRKFAWKANYPKLYLDSFKDLKLVKEKKVKYLAENNTDVMYLLKKNGKRKS
ncbi:methyltransferase domain-containing protein [Patescibacteria group bacterium]|nr:methyltransferase domain-containing protein [Patescibacteria group bacterium]